MNTSKQKLLDKKQEHLEKKRLSEIVSNWVTKNKKVFWKYEVSCFYKTYIIRISNLPEPSVNDILLSANSRLLSDQQKKQLCDVLIKASPRSKALNDSSFDMQIDYDNGVVISKVL